MIENPNLGIGESLKMADPFGRRIFYHNFSDGSLGPLQFGYSERNNPEPRYSFENGELVLSVKLPGLPPIKPLPSDVTAGVFLTPPIAPQSVIARAVGTEGLPITPSLPFDTRSPFALRGTYLLPSGPQTGMWAIGILARTGGVADLTTNIQVVATLQFLPSSNGLPGARLNVPAGATSHQPVPLSPDMYSALDPLYQTPFTLALWINPLYPNGTAYLTVEGYPTLSTSFQLQDFQANSGPAITAVGTVIANRTAYDETVSVHVRDFGIYETT